METLEVISKNDRNCEPWPMQRQQWCQRCAERCGPSLPYIPNRCLRHHKLRNYPSRWWVAAGYRNGGEVSFGGGEYFSFVSWAAKKKGILNFWNWFLVSITSLILLFLESKTLNPFVQLKNARWWFYDLWFSNIVLTTFLIWINALLIQYKKTGIFSKLSLAFSRNSEIFLKCCIMIVWNPFQDST